MKEIITTILNESVTAPSPDNFQPWKFEVNNNIIDVIKIPEKMNHLLDCKEHVLILTIGMLIENISIVATHYHVEASFSYFPETSDSNLVARITLNKNESVKIDELYESVKLRCTNRSFYKKKKIQIEKLDELEKQSKSDSGVDLQIVTDDKQLKKLGSVFSTIDKIIFENKVVHDSLYHHITWSKQEEEKTRQGLSIHAMALNAMEIALFKSLKNWSLVNFLNKLGLSDFIRFNNAKQYSSAPAAFIVSIKNDSNADYINAGRFIERLWLKTNSFGISFHTIVGTIYCYQKIRENENDVFNEKHASLLRENYFELEKIAKENGLVNKNIVYFARIGYPSKPDYRSPRKEASVVFNS